MEMRAEIGMQSLSGAQPPRQFTLEWEDVYVCLCRKKLLGMTLLACLLCVRCVCVAGCRLCRGASGCFSCTCCRRINAVRRRVGQPRSRVRGMSAARVVLQV